jgi:hypothetical protein
MQEYLSHDSRLDPYHTAIGRLANAYAELEYSMNDAIWELSNVERKIGASITAQMIGPGPRTRCLLSLLKLRDAPATIVEAFNKITKDIEGLAGQRNRYVHDPLVIDRDADQVKRVEITANRILRFEFINEEVEKINQLASEIMVATGRFADLYARAVDESPPWPRTQFSQSPGIRVRRTSQNTDGLGHPHQQPSSQE